MSLAHTKGTSALDGASISSRNGAIFVKDGTKARNFVKLDVLDLFVFLEDGLAATGLDGDGSNLLFKGARLPRFGRTPIRLDGVGILLLPGDVHVLDRVFGAVAHREFVVGLCRQVSFLKQA